MLREFTALIGLVGIVFVAGAKIWFRLRHPATLPGAPASGTDVPVRVRTRGHWHQAGRADVPRRRLAGGRV